MLWKKTIVSLIVFIASLIAALAAVGLAAPKEGPSFVVPQFDPESITGLAVADSLNPVELKKVDGKWQVMPEGYPADEAVIKTAIEKAAKLEVGSLRSDNKNLQAELGVTDEGFKVTLSNDSGEVFSFCLGNETTDKKGHFIRNVGEKNVHATRGKVKTAFDKKMKFWRNRKFLGLERDAIQGLKIQRQDIVLDFQKSYDKWTFTQKPTGLAEDFRLDEGGIAGIAGSLASLNASDFPQDIKDAASVGLDPAQITVTMSIADHAEPIVLLIGNSQEKKLYAKRADQPWIYLVSDNSLNKLSDDLEGFRDLTINGFGYNEARAAETNIGETSIKFALNEKSNEWGIVEAGMELEPGFVADPEKIRGLISVLSRLKGEKYIASQVKQIYGFDKPIAAIKVTLADETVKSFTVGKTAGDEEDYATGEDGMVYTIDHKTTERFIRPASEYKGATRQQAPMFTPEMLKNLPPEVQQQFMQKQRQEIMQRQMMKQFMKQQEKNPEAN